MVLHGGWAGWASAHPDFGRLEGTVEQPRWATLLLAHPELGSQLHQLLHKGSEANPCFPNKNVECRLNPSTIKSNRQIECAIKKIKALWLNPWVSNSKQFWTLCTLSHSPQHVTGPLTLVHRLASMTLCLVSLFLSLSCNRTKPPIYLHLIFAILQF